MLNKEAFEGLLKTTPQKRYKSFLNTVTDREEVWGLISTDQKTLAVSNDGCIMVWPYKEFCELMLSPNYSPQVIEVHDFLELCKTLKKSACFSIFPTNENSYVVSAEQLCIDIQEHLDELE